VDGREGVFVVAVAAVGVGIAAAAVAVVTKGQDQEDCGFDVHDACQLDWGESQNGGGSSQSMEALGGAGYA